MELVLKKLGMDFNYQHKFIPNYYGAEISKISDLVNYRIGAEVKGTFLGKPHVFFIEVTTDNFDRYGISSKIEFNIYLEGRSCVYFRAMNIKPNQTDILDYINKLLHTNFNKIKIVDNI